MWARNPRQIKIALGVALLVILVMAFAFGAYYGKKAALEHYGDLGIVNNQLVAALNTANAEIDALRNSVAEFKLSSDVDRLAAEKVRGELRDLNNTIAELEEAVAFYKGVMDPDKNKRGLSIASFDVFASDSDVNAFRYKVVVVQLAGNHRLLKGTAALRVIGTQAGQLVSFPLSQLSDDVKSEKIKLRFKYFQEISGEMQLPEDFIPERVNITATSLGKHATTVEQKYDWIVQES